MDPIQGWKNLSNVERAEVLRVLKNNEDTRTDRTPWLRAIEVLQAIAETPVLARDGY